MYILPVNFNPDDEKIFLNQLSVVNTAYKFASGGMISVNSFFREIAGQYPFNIKKLHFVVEEGKPVKTSDLIEIMASHEEAMAVIFRDKKAVLVDTVFMPQLAEGQGVYYRHDMFYRELVLTPQLINFDLLKALCINF